MGISFAIYAIFDEAIATQFPTWQNMCTAMGCDKMGSALMLTKRITVIQIFHQIVMKISFVNGPQNYPQLKRILN